MARRPLMARGAALLLALALPCAAQAQSCRLPATIATPAPVLPDGPVRQRPIAGYTLALSWSPAFCRSHGPDPREALQCSGRFGFILHGLWPEASGRDWPQWCPTRLRPDPATVRRHLCMTPSPDLIAHEWAKHGSCMSRTPQAYFGEAERLWRRVRLPDMAALAARPALTAGDLRRAFIAANPALPMRGIRLLLGRDGTLREVHLCLSRARRYAACPVGRTGPGNAARVTIVAP